MEIYQWLFRQNNFQVSDAGYFVYCNGIKNRESFNEKLEFEITVISYTGSDSWVSGTIDDIFNCLQQDTLPNSTNECDFCHYRSAVNESTQSSLFLL